MNHQPIPLAQAPENFVPLTAPYKRGETHMLAAAVKQLERGQVDFRLVSLPDGRLELWRTRAGFAHTRYNFGERRPAGPAR